MTSPQLVTLAVLLSVVAALIWGKVRSDVVALAGAAVLLGTRTIRPVEVQGAFASPAIIALASLFVIAYAMELSGLLGLIIRGATRLCARLGALGLWIVIAVSGAASAFLNNTPIVVLAAPVVKDVAESLNLSPKRFLIPLSYVTILGGACTLIGTSTNLLVNDMARNAGQPVFSMFEITPVGLVVGLAGGLYLFLFGGRLLGHSPSRSGEVALPEKAESAAGDDPSVFPLDRPFRPFEAVASLVVFVGVVTVAALGVAPIAASAFSGAVLLVVLRVISAEDAYKGLRPEILLLIAGMVVVGLSLEVTGLAALATNALVGWVTALGPWMALALLYGATLFLTEILSNAAVAVLLTPVAVALAESLGVNPRPFLVGIMMAASAAFATPFGYQTNVLVYQMGRYSYLDFVRIGVPLNLLTWLVGVAIIPFFFPF
ncbi:SLC13 family permease [Phenylobacterium immobile]|uniref:SLC13 family permease n=1 Tax=Phenylobacterium immobile TaxID=21 RepID=UPI000A430199|nr:SLC13 family permease [Phenylobacterium immobile]